MIEGKSILAVIPARGGSKGVKKKNIREINGKPLIAFTLTETEKSKYIDQIIVSTDDNEIREVVEKYGNYIPFMRPKELATDSAKSVDVVLHTLNKVKGYDYIILLQPTSPMRSSKHIDECLELLVHSERNTAVSFCKTDKHPYWMYHIGTNQNIMPYEQPTNEEITRRQDLETIYVLNGAIYISDVSFFLREKTFLSENTLPYVMPEENSLDIDSHLDFKIFECLLKNNF